MTGKNYNRHKHWTRTSAGHLQHDSGLLVLVTHGDGYTDLETDDASMAIFQASETSRGVPTHQFAERVRRLVKEDEAWHKKNP